MGLTLSLPPGYADLQDSVLAANQPALGLDLGKIYGNSVFGMVRPEVFVFGPFKNGDTVPLPVSSIDGYAYSRNELIYLWTVQNSVDQSTGWITGKDSLWYVAYMVDQSTGVVSIDEWYRRSGSHYDGVHTNDGTLTVWVIGQRQQSSLIMAASPSYSAITSGWIGVDEPLSQQLAQGMNDDAKFSVVNKEVFYCGEFYNGQTVPKPVSLADGYTYSYAECQFMFSWRWTPPGNASVVSAPNLSDGQLAVMQASVNSSGVVSTTITYDDNNGNLASYNDGRIAVFAFCKRSGTPATLTPTANLFVELSFDDFMPGSDLPNTTVQQIVNNILQALVEVEYFGPTTHANGDTIPTPTSAVDGYAYARSELTYIWAFSDTTMASGSNLRMASFGGKIDQSTGVVSLYGYRLPPGGPYTAEDTTKPRISVIVVARRNAEAQSNITGSTTTPANGVTGSSSGSGADTPTISTIEVNGTAIPNDPNFSDSTPAAPSGKTNVKWQSDALSPSDISAYMPNLVGDSGSGGTSGAVPAPASGDAAAGKYLKADGTWTVPPTGVTAAQVQQESLVYAADTGAANAYAVSLSPAPTLVAGSIVVFEAAHANTGASTLAVNGGAATPIKKQGSTALASGDISAGQIVAVVYDGTNFQLLAGAGGGGGTSSPLTTKGDIWGYGTGDTRIPVGSDGQWLEADSTQTQGVKWANQPYDVVWSLPGKPGANTRYLICVFTRPVTFPANFASVNAQGKCLTNPTATATYTLEKNLSNCGTVSISTSGVFSFTSASGLAVSFAAGDYLTVVTPNPQDSTLSDAGFTLAGTR